MSRTETILGLTPVLKRIAHYYLCLGHGTYHPENHPHYDCVVVKELYPFDPNPRDSEEFAGGTAVEFYRQGNKIKWVEFRCQVVGGGGETVIQRVK